MSYVWKNTSQIWAVFAFDSTYLHQTFTECVSNQYTHFNVSTCQMWLQVIEHFLILLRFFLGIFIYLFDNHSCLNCCISTKPSQIVSLINVHTYTTFEPHAIWNLKNTFDKTLPCRIYRVVLDRSPGSIFIFLIKF